MIKSPNVVENATHALLRLYSTPCSRCFCVLTDFTTGILQITGEHVATRFCLVNDVPFLLLVSFARVFSPTASVATRGPFTFERLFIDTVRRVVPFCRSRIKRTVVIQSFSEKFATCVVTETMVTKFPMLQSITLLPLDYLGVPPV